MDHDRAGSVTISLRVTREGGLRLGRLGEAQNEGEREREHGERPEEDAGRRCRRHGRVCVFHKENSFKAKRFAQFACSEQKSKGRAERGAAHFSGEIALAGRSS